MDDYAIIVDSVSMRYGNNLAVKDLSFKVRNNVVHGFLGPNGAGKSTTMRVIAGLENPTSGSSWVDGICVQKSGSQARKNIGILLENPPLYHDMIVKDYLSYVAKLHNVAKSEVKQMVDSAIESLELKEVEDRLIGNLSKGFKQRVGVAQAIVHNPKIVILDEPTVGLDPQAVIKMRELIKSLSKDHTILLSSHLLHEISLICDEVTIINKGSLQLSGPLEQIQSEIRAKHIIEVELQKLSTDFIESVKKLKPVQELTTNGNSVQIYNDQSFDIRADISKIAVKLDCGLLSMTQSSTSLEDIFISVTSSEAI